MRELVDWWRTDKGLNWACLEKLQVCVLIKYKGEPAWEEESQPGDHWFELLASLGRCLSPQVCLQEVHWACVGLDPELGAGVNGAKACAPALMGLPFLEKGQMMQGCDTNKQFWMFKYENQAESGGQGATENQRGRPPRQDHGGKMRVGLKGENKQHLLVNDQDCSTIERLAFVSARRSRVCLLLPFSRFWKQAGQEVFSYTLAIWEVEKGENEFCFELQF